MQGKVQQVVFDYELIEHIRRQDNGGRHGDANAGKAAGDTALAQKVAHKGEAASFPTEGTGADPQKTRFRRLERVGLEVADQHLALLAAILVNRLDQIAPQMFRAGKIRNFSRTELGRQRKLGSCHQPMGEVVALRMKDDAFRRNRLQLLLQLSQVFRPSDFTRIRQTKHEVAKPELLGQYPAQVLQQRGRTFAQKRIALGVRPRPELGAAALQNYGNVRHQALHHARQFKPRLRAQLALPGKLHVRYQTEQIVAILLH